MSRTTRGSRWLRPTTAALVGVGLACSTTSSEARQVEGFGPMIQFDGQFDDISTADSDMIEGFTVASGAKPLADTAAGEAIKLIEAEDWLKAIRAIGELSTDDDTMVRDQHGIVRPLATFKTALLNAMPEQGLRDFRKLNGPAADTLLKQAHATASLDERAQAYEKLLNEYALCDASANAAEALGDIRFEQGKFDQAANLYRFAADHPAADSDDPMLMARQLVCLARANQWQRFDKLAQYAAFRHPDTAIKLGANPTTLPTLIDQLNQSRANEPANHNNDQHLVELLLPHGQRPAYQQTLIDPAQHQNLKFAAQNNNLGHLIDHIVQPVVATDDQGRLFTLAAGSVTRIDPVTGNQAWRFGNPDEHIDRIKNETYQLARGYHQALSVHGDNLLAVVPDTNRPQCSRLFVLDTQTGDERWKWPTGSLNSSRTRCPIGQPLVAGDRIYTVTQSRGDNLIKLVALSLETGEELATQDLGTALVEQNYNAVTQLSPRLTMGQDHLFVQTNNGAMIALDSTDLDIRWAYTQPIRSANNNQNGRFRRHAHMPTQTAKHTGTVVARDGLVLVKDTRGNRVTAIREIDAAQAWSIKTNHDSTIVHSDEKHVYVLGEQLIAYDLQTGEKAWWTPHAGEKAGTPAFTHDACLIAGNMRFCRVDLTTGKLTDYREDLADPADLALTGNRLIHLADNKISVFSATSEAANP